MLIDERGIDGIHAGAAPPPHHLSHYRRMFARNLTMKIKRLLIRCFFAFNIWHILLHYQCTAYQSKGFLPQNLISIALIFKTLGYCKEFREYLALHF